MEIKQNPTPNEVLTELSGVLHRIPLAHREIIIRAVHSHEALLTASRRARQWLGASGDEVDIEICELLDKAIAQAEGQS